MAERNDAIVRRFNKILSFALAGAALLSSGIPALADTEISTSGGSAQTTLVLTAEASQMSVTVPTSLSITVSNDSVATVGQGYVVNNSAGMVEVKSITLSDGTFELTQYGTREQFSVYPVGSRKLGLSIAFGGGKDNTDDPELTGTAVSYVTGTDFTSGTPKNVPVGTLKIAPTTDANHNNKLLINPTASVAPIGASAPTGETAATMTFVVGWYTGS